MSRKWALSQKIKKLIQKNNLCGVCIVDTSAIISDPKFYTTLPKSNYLVLILKDVIAEIDEKKNYSGKPKFDSAFDEIRSWIDKGELLSKGISIAGHLMLYVENNDNMKKFSSFFASKVDAKVLTLAKKLKKQINDVKILGADNLIQIVSHLNKIDYFFIKSRDYDIKSEDEKTITDTNNIDLVGQGQQDSKRNK